MQLIKTLFDSVLVLKPNVHKDNRGSLLEVYNESLSHIINDFNKHFCLEYYSISKKNVIRGLHYQIDITQGKLVTAINGAVFDVVVDIRKNSPTFGEHEVVELNEENRYMIWIPPGFAHGFQCLINNSILSYKCDGQYSPLHERCVKWSDSTLDIQWPNISSPVISEKDRLGVGFENADYFNMLEV